MGRFRMVVALVACAVSANAWAQQSATIDETGEKVVLEKDGTWAKADARSEPSTAEDAAAEEKPQFEWRGLRWGMSEKKVRRVLRKAKDVKPLKGAEKEPGLIKYTTEIGSEDYVLAVHIQEDRLNYIVLVRAERERNDNRHFEALAEVIAEIGKKYGEMKGGLRWSNDLFRDDSARWGTALTLDHVEAFYEVETDYGTRVVVMLEGGQTPRLMIVYSDLGNPTKDTPSGF